MPHRQIRRCALAFALAALVFPPGGQARDGIGRVVAQPNRLTAGTANNTITFTYTADAAALRGQLHFVVPPGWTAPQVSNAARPGYVRIARRGCAAATRVVSVRGRTVSIDAVCRRGTAFRLAYSGVLAPTLAAPGYTFLTASRTPAKNGRPARFLPLAPLKQPIVAVIGGPVDHLQITTTSVAIAGASFSLTVRPIDVYGNTARDATGAYYSPTVTLTSTDAKATLPASYTFVANDFGTHTFRGLVLNTPGTQTITVSDPTGVTGDSLPITVWPY